MHHISYRIDIDAPVAQTWALAGDPARIADWLPALDSVRMDGDLRIGTMPDGTVTNERIVAHDDAGRTYTYELVEDGSLPLKDYSSTFVVTGDERSSTVVWSADFECDDEMKQALDGFYSSGLDALREAVQGQGAPR